MTYSDFIVYFGASLTLILKGLQGIQFLLQNKFHNYIGRKVIQTDELMKRKQELGISMIDRTRSEMTNQY